MWFVESLKRIHCLSNSKRAVVHFTLKCNGLISTICQMAVKCVNHVPNSHTNLTFKGSYLGHCLPEVSLHPSYVSQNFPHLALIINMLWYEGIFQSISIFSIYSYTDCLTSSLWSLCWTSQVTVACGERGTHSRKVLLFSVPYTTLSSVTSRSSGWRRDKKNYAP